jgi:hypothetical protein
MTLRQNKLKCSNQGKYNICEQGLEPTLRVGQQKLLWDKHFSLFCDSRQRRRKNAFGPGANVINLFSSPLTFWAKCLSFLSFYSLV